MVWDSRRKYTEEELREIQHSSPNRGFPGFWYDFNIFKKVVAETILEKRNADELFEYLQYVIKQINENEDDWW